MTGWGADWRGGVWQGTARRGGVRSGAAGRGELRCGAVWLRGIYPLIF